MVQTGKVILISVLVFVIAWVTTPLREPSTASIRADYEQLYSQLQQQQSVSAEEKQQLEAQFRKLNSQQTIEKELSEILLRNGVFFLLMLPLAFFAARTLGLDKQQVLIVAGLTGVAFIIQGAVISGAILAALFAVAGLSKSRQAA